MTGLVGVCDRVGGGDESLLNVEIKQFQVYGRKGEEGISHMY